MKRVLGRSGIEVSVVGMGCSGNWGSLDLCWVHLQVGARWMIPSLCEPFMRRWTQARIFLIRLPITVVATANEFWARL